MQHRKGIIAVIGALVSGAVLAGGGARFPVVTKVYSGHGSIYLSNLVIQQGYGQKMADTLNGIQSNNFQVTLPNYIRIDPYGELVSYVRLISPTTGAAGRTDMNGNVWLNFSYEVPFIMPTLVHEADHSRYGSHTCGTGADADDTGPYGVDAYYSLQLYWNSQNMDTVQKNISAGNATSIAYYGFCGSIEARTRVLDAYQYATFSQPPTSLHVTAAIGVANTGGTNPYAIVNGSDGNLWQHYWTGSAWAWSNLLKPYRTDASAAPIEIASAVGAVTVNGGLPSIFVRGTDGNLWNNYWTGRSWVWNNSGKPASGVDIATSVGATVVDGGRPYVFVTGTDGNLWHNWWSGSAWNWNSLGTPGTAINLSVGAMAVDGGRPYAFVTGADGNLWTAWWSGSAWGWGNLGRPATTNIARSVGTALIGGGAPNIFVVGGDGNMWTNYWSGSSWNWANLNTPPGVGIANTVGVTMLYGNSPYVFVTGTDGNLWTMCWNGYYWQWDNLGRPGLANIASGVGATETLGQYPYVYVTDGSGHLWLLNWTGWNWSWSEQRYTGI